MLHIFLAQHSVHKLYIIFMGLRPFSTHHTVLSAREKRKMAQISTKPEQPAQVEGKETEVPEEAKKKSDLIGLPFYKLLKYADALDWILMALGTIGSVVHGMAQPVGYLLLGKALNAFGSHIQDTDGMVKALKKVDSGTALTVPRLLSTGGYICSRRTFKYQLTDCG